jgi:hypothetical protein
MLLSNNGVVTPDTCNEQNFETLYILDVIYFTWVSPVVLSPERYLIKGALLSIHEFLTLITTFTNSLHIQSVNSSFRRCEFPMGFVTQYTLWLVCAERDWYCVTAACVRRTRLVLCYCCLYTQNATGTVLLLLVYAECDWDCVTAACVRRTRLGLCYCCLCTQNATGTVLLLLVYAERDWVGLCLLKFLSIQGCGLRFRW